MSYRLCYALYKKCQYKNAGFENGVTKFTIQIIKSQNDRIVIARF